MEQDKLRFSLHAGQSAAWRSKRRFTWMLAGTQGGKTSFLPVWLYREMQARGEGDYLAVTASFPLLRLKMLPEFRRFFEYQLGLATYKASENVLLWRKGETRIIFGSATNPESLESATAKGAVLDECGQKQFRLDSWEAIQRRLSLFRGRVLGGTTIYDLGWLKQYVYEPWLKGDPDHEVIQFDSILNPAFPKEEYERAERVLPKWKFDMFYRGRFTRPGNLIYADFIHFYRDQGGHIVEPFEIPAAWPRVIGVDFGAVNTALVYLALAPNGAIYVYGDNLSGGQTTAQHCNALRLSCLGLPAVYVFGGSGSEEQQRWDWQANGIPIQRPPVGDVEAGIDRVITFIRGKRFFVFDTCRGLLDELGSYSRKVDSEGNTLEEIEEKSIYHRLDALRYAIGGFTVTASQPLPAYYEEDNVVISPY